MTEMASWQVLTGIRNANRDHWFGPRDGKALPIQVVTRDGSVLEVVEVAFDQAAGIVNLLAEAPTVSTGNGVTLTEAMAAKDAADDAMIADAHQRVISEMDADEAKLAADEYPADGVS